MYKVYFNERVIILTSKIKKDLTDDFNSILKYSNQGELNKFIQNFKNNTNLKSAIIYWHNERKLLQNFRKVFKNIIAAGGLVWNADKTKFLIIKRLGKVDLPKGKIEKNESYEQAALREVEEECGLPGLVITGTFATTYHVYTLKENTILKETKWFEMVYNGVQIPVPQTDENIEYAIWVRPAESPGLIDQAYPSIKDVLKKSELILKHL